MGDGAKGESSEPLSAWDIAVRYHELKKHLKGERAQALRKISARAVLARARSILGSVSHPNHFELKTLSELGGDADLGALDLEASIEAGPLQMSGKFALDPELIYIESEKKSQNQLILSVDTSLSMTGEKLALTAVALAVVLLQFQEDPVGIVAFENEAVTIKSAFELITVDELIERFLDIPAQGYTHLEEGLMAALKMQEVMKSHRGAKVVSTILLTDGKYTAGKDPGFLAKRFDHLSVIKMGDEKAGLGLCQELSRDGKGLLREVERLQELPLVMYDVVKDVLRGRAPMR